MGAKKAQNVAITRIAEGDSHTLRANRQGPSAKCCISAGLVCDFVRFTHQGVILKGLVCDSGGFTHQGRYYFVILALVLKSLRHQNKYACTINLNAMKQKALVILIAAIAAAGCGKEGILPSGVEGSTTYSVIDDEEDQIDSTSFDYTIKVTFSEGGDA